MVVADGHELLALVRGHDRPRVARVGYPHIVVNDEHHDGARARFVPYLVHVLLHERGLGLLEPVDQRLLGIGGESGLACDDIVEVVAQELGAAVAAMAVENREEGGLLDAWCQRLVWLRSGLLQVQYDRYPVLVVVPRGAVVGVGRVG